MRFLFYKGQKSKRKTNSLRMVSALKGAKTIRLFVLQIPWRRKLERSDEFKSSNKRVRPLFLPGR